MCMSFRMAAQAMMALPFLPLAWSRSQKARMAGLCRQATRAVMYNAVVAIRKTVGGIAATPRIAPLYDLRPWVAYGRLRRNSPIKENYT